MAEYIDRDAFIEHIRKDPLFGLVEQYGVTGVIKAFPATDVQPVVHGKNLDRETPSIFTCSVCGWHSWDTYCGDTSEYNYCPNCGATMDGET